MSLAQAVVTPNFAVGGLQFQGPRTISGPRNAAYNPTTPAAKTSTAYTHSTSSAASLTFGAGHGFTTGQALDLFWVIGGVQHSRRRCVVGTVSGNTVPIASGGTGDSLPSVDGTVFQAMSPVVMTSGLVGNNLSAFCLSTSVYGAIALFDSGPTLLIEKLILPGDIFEWDNLSGDTNSLAGVTVATVNFSHNGTAAAIMKLVAMLSS